MGEAEDLVGKYAWHLGNSSNRSHPAGLLRPNDLGLFDLHGNDWEWCQSKVDNRGIADPLNDVEDKVDSKGSRSLGGGSFNDSASVVRSALPNFGLPALRDLSVGFRPARTFR